MMTNIIHYIANNPILLGIAILVVALIVFSILKRLARLALFLVTLAVVAYFVLRWLGKI